MSYERGQAVEVGHEGKWVPGVYETADEGGHYVHVPTFGGRCFRSDSDIRPVPPPAPSFAFGDEVSVRDGVTWVGGRYVSAYGSEHRVVVGQDVWLVSTERVRPAPQPAKSELRGWLTVQIGVVRYSEADARAKAENFALNNPGRQFVVVPMPDKVCVSVAKPEWRDA